MKVLQTIFMALVLPALAAAQTIPPNTIDCRSFTKKPNGVWHAIDAVFDIGSAKRISFKNIDIAPGNFNFGGADLATVLTTLCTSS